MTTLESNTSVNKHKMTKSIGQNKTQLKPGNETKELEDRDRAGKQRFVQDGTLCSD